jgi:AraC family transcriptional regulator of adaptative response / DNA-3-methyladenine glycosylase II
VKAARALAGRLTASFGDPAPAESASCLGLRFTFPRPERIAEVEPASIGMPRARGTALRALAERAASDPGLFERGGSLADSIARFRSLPGIGEWTAQYIALRALREPDAFPATDIGLLRGIHRASGQRLTAAELSARAERWRPFRGYAAQHLWALDAERAHPTDD